MYCGSGGNIESGKQELGPEVGESEGITLELSCTGISHIIKIMTILDKTRSLCKSEEAQQSTGAVGKLGFLLPNELIICF